MQKVLFSVVVVLLAVGCLAISSPTKEFRKQLAGPPSEFSSYRPPAPEAAALVSSSAWVPVDLKKSPEGGYSWSDSLPVDSAFEFSISIFCNEYKNLKISVQPPNSPMTLLDDAIFNSPDSKGKRVVHDFGVGLTQMEVLTFIWPEPISGFWTILIQSDNEIPHVADKPEAYLLLGNESPIKVATNLNTYDLQVGEEVGLVTRVFNVPEGVEDPMAELAPMQGVILSAEMDIILPNGKEIVMQMNDKGTNGDFMASDGVYSAVIEATQPGTYVATCTIKGRTAEGQDFIRNTLESFSVITPDLTLTGLASATIPAEKEVIQFFLDVDTLQSVESRAEPLKARAYAEVWGTDQSGSEYVPVAWVQAMVDVERKGDRQVLALELNKKWVQLAKAQAPFQLRNVEIQEPNTNNPYSERKEIYVSMHEQDASILSAMDFNIVPEITEEMRKGPRPASLKKATADGSADDHHLLLVHGYCAGVNEFPPEQFTNPYIFKDFKQSKSNDKFALTIKEAGDQFSSFSIVGHSQAGLASLHLLAYYWSGIDNSNGGRLVQSVGSPYQGTSIAGFLADLGSIFGLGCGSNYDLSRSGAANWLSKIPLDVRKDVWYYTTQYDDYWWLLENDCVTAGNLVLHKPNDGTTEKKYGQLPGANNAGHKKAWCHTNGMKYKAQCLDAERNKEMNEKAARSSL